MTRTALMGANMSRQAVLCCVPKSPWSVPVSNALLPSTPAPWSTAKRGGIVDYVDATRIVIRVNDDEAVAGGRRDIFTTRSNTAFQPEHQHPPASHRQPWVTRWPRVMIGGRRRPTRAKSPSVRTC